MTEPKGIRKNVMLDQDSLDILEFFEQKEMKGSGVIRLALKQFYEGYVKRALKSGEMEIDVDGNPSLVDQLLSKPRKEALAPQIDNKQDDIHVFQE